MVVLAAVVLIVAWPLTAQRTRAQPEQARELAELEAAREAKYREIRDAELDHQTGKLSDEDFQALNSTLRAEALEILDAIDRYHQRTK